MDNVGRNVKSQRRADAKFCVLDFLESRLKTGKTMEFATLQLCVYTCIMHKWLSVVHILRNSCPVYEQKQTKRLVRSIRTNYAYWFGWGFREVFCTFHQISRCTEWRQVWRWLSRNFIIRNVRRKYIRLDGCILWMCDIFAAIQASRDSLEWQFSSFDPKQPNKQWNNNGYTIKHYANVLMFLMGRIGAITSTISNLK